MNRGTLTSKVVLSSRHETKPCSGKQTQGQFNVGGVITSFGRGCSNPEGGEITYPGFLTDHQGKTMTKHRARSPHGSN